jgi:hypothetical protein
MKVVINGSEADYPYIFVNGVKMPATFIARPANPRVDMGRRIIIEPALPEGGNTLLTADYLDFEINEVVISDNPSAYTPADVLRLLNEGFESPTGDDFPGIGSGLYSGGGGSPEIPDGSITTAKLADGAVTTAKIANASITQNHLQIDSVGYPQIIDGSIDSTKVKDASIPGGKLMEQTLTTRELQPRSVTTDILADNSVTTNKIVDGAVTEAKLAPSSVATEKLQDLCVTTPKIADQAVDTTKLNTGGDPGGSVE